MGVERLRLVFRVKLATDKPWVSIARQLDHLDKLAIGRHTAKHQTFIFEALAKLRIELVTMSMALSNGVFIVNSFREGAAAKLAGIGSETHCPTEVLDAEKVLELCVPSQSLD